MGNRIAILREGELVQYDTPDRILADPANEFVADFVGADRGLKRLVVWRLRDLQLDSGQADGPHAHEDTSLRDALSLMLTEGVERVTVLDGDDRAKGTRRAGDDHAPDRPRRARPCGHERVAGPAGPGHPRVRAGQRLRARERAVLRRLVRRQLRPRVRTRAWSSTSS